MGAVAAVRDGLCGGIRRALVFVASVGVIAVHPGRWIIDLPAEHVHYVQEYDDVEAILHLAHEYQIDAIYPGYGFLAENADFAERVERAGLRFIGPTPATLRAVGDKDAAIALAKKLGIPTIPGDDSLIAFAHTHRQDEIAAEAVRRTLAMAQDYPGYPIRLKHPAGGGGKHDE